MMRSRVRTAWVIVLLLVVALCLNGCEQTPAPTLTPTPEPTPTPVPSREDAIPADAVKGLPETDLFPPVLHSDAWELPVPMGAPITTAGAEDSPFFSPDGQHFLFFFTPDVRVPAERQLLDGVTGIWWSQRSGDGWAEPQKLVLNDDLALDGCPFVLGDTLWFCSVRAGNYRNVDFYTAVFRGGRWTDWQNAGQLLNEQYGVGELHISADGSVLYFSAEREGGLGGTDLWKCAWADGTWSEPVNLGPTVNSAGNEGRPFLSQDGSELWFDGTSRLGYPGPALFRSVRNADGTWGPPEEVVSRFAGEPTMDVLGNLYFVHHFFSEDGRMLEADIYVAKRK